jgi:hypothetical protein
MGTLRAMPVALQLIDEDPLLRNMVFATLKMVLHGR